MLFQSTHPVRGATRSRTILFCSRLISIHAPRAGCDRRSPRRYHQDGHFNPRTPCGVRRFPSRRSMNGPRFQSTHPVRGATRGGTTETLLSQNFNPRTPCGVRRREASCKCGRWHFNPRTPCGVRPRNRRKFYPKFRFQSTHPVRGATAKLDKTPSGFYPICTALLF